MNKWGIRVSYFLTLLSLFGSIFFTDSWWQNFSFSILGGSLFSNIICVVNYIIQLKESAESIALGLYDVGNSGFSSLFSTKKDLTLEEGIRTLSILSEKFFSVYVKSDDLLKSLFWFDRRKNEVKRLHISIDGKLVYVYEVSSYIQVYSTEASTLTKQIYKDLENFIDNDVLYIKSLEIARSFKSKIHSLEESHDRKKIQQQCADRYRKTLKK